MKYQELFPVPVEWLEATDISLASTVNGWAEQEVKTARLEHRESLDALLRPAIRKLFVDIGLQGMLWPEASGGAGITAAEAAMAGVAALEAAGAADCGIAFVLANTLAVQQAFSVEPHRDESIMEEFSPLFCGSEPSVAALVLPGFGSGPAGRQGSYFGLEYQVAAREEDGGLILDGSSIRPQCSGADAALFGVVCEHGGEPALALVPGEAKGLSRGETILKTGLTASVNADLVLKGVTVPDRMVVARGIERMREVLAWYYSGCAAVCSGAMLASYEILKEWGDTRVIKGKGQIFKENPLTASLMGEIAGRCAISRILSFNLARMLSRPDIYGPAGGHAMFATATAVVKNVSRDVMLAINNAMELMASAGYATEWNLERYWRDVKTIETYAVPETVAETDMARHYFDLKVL